MAIRLAQGRRIVAYLPNLQAAVQHFRSFSYDESERPHTQDNNPALTKLKAEPQIWPDNLLGPIAPTNGKFPMPGHVGVEKQRTTYQMLMPRKSPRLRAANPDVLTAQLPTDRHVEAVKQFMDAKHDFGEVESIANSSTLECVAQECPAIMKKDFKDLFPGKPIDEGDLTVITISQKTNNDMTGWSEGVEEERERLLEQFVKGAREICEALTENGYWANFIDPSSGRPYLGEYTNATMFETDERYRRLGFDIQDLGCCKVISHHVWGTHSYVGCLFTDAPVYHPIICEMTKVPFEDGEEEDPL